MCTEFSLWAHLRGFCDKIGLSLFANTKLVSFIPTGVKVMQQYLGVGTLATFIIVLEATKSRVPTLPHQIIFVIGTSTSHQRHTNTSHQRHTTNGFELLTR